MLVPCSQRYLIEHVCWDSFHSLYCSFAVGVLVTRAAGSFWEVQVLACASMHHLPLHPSIADVCAQHEGGDAGEQLQVRSRLRGFEQARIQHAMAFATCAGQQGCSTSWQCSCPPGHLPAKGAID